MWSRQCPRRIQLDEFRMSISDFLVGIPRLAELSPKAKALLVAYHLRQAGQTEFSIADLESQFRDGGLPAIENLHLKIPKMSSGKSPALLHIGGGKYSLTVYGLQEVQDYLSSVAGIRPAAKSLEKLVGRLSVDADQNFLAEAVACVQIGAKRAAVVMSWLLTLNHLEEYVLKHKLSEFNNALRARTDCRGLQITRKDDFGEIRKECYFIELLRSAMIISNDIRKILDEKLGFRNTCAHPSQVTIPDTKVLAAIEDLVENVILKFPI